MRTFQCGDGSARVCFSVTVARTDEAPQDGKRLSVAQASDPEALFRVCARSSVVILCMEGVSANGLDALVILIKAYADMLSHVCDEPHSFWFVGLTPEQERAIGEALSSSLVESGAQAAPAV